MEPLVWRIGDVTITALAEVEWRDLDLTWLFADATPERLLPLSGWLHPHFLGQDGRVHFTVQTFVVESEDRRLLVDTCIGNDKPRKSPRFDRLRTDFLERLTAAGFAPESIDTVLCTHLHLDHVGWNTRLEGGRWVPTFARARYLLNEAEWAHWEAAGTAEHVLDDSLRPVVEAGLAELVASDHDVTGEVSLLPAPGHTPGHVAVGIASGGARAIITGDLLHHPFQCAHPDWRCGADSDPAKALETRLAFLRSVADQPTLVLGSHFARPTAGRVVSDGDAWRFVV
jgi:glyoxylase-like metal-dependent hydrolase (beta-lactamase superfamily II)